MVIVVVDDEPDARALARRVLERAGHTVHTARHPVAALALLDEHNGVDMVLTDLHMPRMDGRELARRIETTHPDVACVIWSTAGHDEATGVLPKNVMSIDVESWFAGTEGPAS